MTFQLYFFFPESVLSADSTYSENFNLIPRHTRVWTVDCRLISMQKRLLDHIGRFVHETLFSVPSHAILTKLIIRSTLYHMHV